MRIKIADFREDLRVKKGLDKLPIPAFVKEVGISEDTYYRWSRGDRNPYSTTLEGSVAVAIKHGLCDSELDFIGRYGAGTEILQRPREPVISVKGAGS